VRRVFRRWLDRNVQPIYVLDPCVVPGKSDNYY
jgi:hypothetical protein